MRLIDLEEDTNNQSAVKGQKLGLCLQSLIFLSPHRVTPFSRWVIFMPALVSLALHHEATESKLHLNDRCFYSCFWITRDLDVKNVLGFWVFLRRPGEQMLSGLYILANLLGNKRSWFVICLCVSVFQGSLLLNLSVWWHVFEQHSKIYLTSKFFCLLYTETLQVQVKLFLQSFQIQRIHRYGRVKTNRYFLACCLASARFTIVAFI